MTATIDPRCPWVQVHPAPDGPAWRLVKFIFENADESGGNHNIYLNLLRSDGTPAGSTRVYFGWPTFDKPDDFVIQPTTPQGNTDFPMGANANINDAHPRGPYWAMPERAKNAADMVDGMGLPNNRHVNYRLFYQWQEAVTPEPPPDTEPDFWSAVRAVSSQIPPAQYISMPWQGRTYQLSRYAGGGVIAVEAERPGFVFLMYPAEVLK